VVIPAALGLALVVWLLTLHPFASGRVYAAYGGVYVATALGWLWFVAGIRSTF
jgi:small multidrug resistance family-3 protein